MLQKNMARQGNWLFSWRSYLPFVVIPVAMTVFPQSGWMMQLLGELFEEGYDLACFTLAIAGVAVRVLTVGYVPAGTSGRNTRTQKAEALNTTGLYSIVRHPLYFANFLSFIGIVLTIKSALFVLFAACAFFLYYERIMLAEEQFLNQRYGGAYRRWAARTPTFFPRMTEWIAPALPFSWRSALRREFHGVFLIASLFLVSEMAESMLIDGHGLSAAIRDEWIWVTLFALNGALYAAVMTIKKRTNWLNVPESDVVDQRSRVKSVLSGPRSRTFDIFADIVRHSGARGTSQKCTTCSACAWGFRLATSWSHGRPRSFF